MPVPSYDKQMELIRAFDLNPLIQLELLHKQMACFSECFVSPRQNKQFRTSDEKPAFESIIFNVAIRDTVVIEKMRVLKVI